MLGVFMHVAFILGRSSKYHPNYFTSSDPHHDMLGEGCQVNVIYHVKQAFQNVQTRHTCFLECCTILSHPARYSV